MSIDQSTLTRLAGKGAYARGVDLYEDGAVLSINAKTNAKGSQISAEVQGTHRYYVRLQITDQILDGHCDCPASENFDFCKHCVAAALSYSDKIAQKGELKNAPDIERIKAYIDQLPEQQLKDSLIQLIAEDNLLINKWALKADSAFGSIDPKQLKKQITKALPYRSYWEYAKVRKYFRDAENALEPILEVMSALDSQTVFSLATYMSERLNRLLEGMDDSGGYRFDLEVQIHEILTTSFKQLPWTAKKKSAFLIKAHQDRMDIGIFPHIPTDFLDSGDTEVSKLFYQEIEKQWNALPNLNPQSAWEDEGIYHDLLSLLLKPNGLPCGITREIELRAKMAIDTRDYLALVKLNLSRNTN